MELKIAQEKCRFLTTRPAVQANRTAKKRLSEIRKAAKHILSSGVTRDLTGTGKGSLPRPMLACLQSELGLGDAPLLAKHVRYRNPW